MLWGGVAWGWLGGNEGGCKELGHFVPPSRLHVPAQLGVGVSEWTRCVPNEGLEPVSSRFPFCAKVESGV